MSISLTNTLSPKRDKIGLTPLMRILTTRRICQVFFFCLFIWFCIVATLGDDWWQLRGWPVNWFLELDPLVGLATLLTTGTLYAGLLWGLATVVLTIILGRFFCGWVCPFGSMHQFVGYMAHRQKPTPEKVRLNRPHRLQVVKYGVLMFLLAAAAGDLPGDLTRWPDSIAWQAGAAAAAILLLAVLYHLRQSRSGQAVWADWLLAAVVFWLVFGLVFQNGLIFSASLQIGLLDPIALAHRSVNLILLPLATGEQFRLTAQTRLYEGAWLVGTVFAAALGLNLIIPRFYCRFICPLGALFGVLARFALWRIGKTEQACTDCHLCEKHCEGACSPTSRIRINECVLCLNCLDECRHGLIEYSIRPSASGESLSPDLSRRQLMLSAAGGLASIPLVRLGGQMASNWNPQVIRPPGALAEADFVERCIKCGQCMRVCPTNVIHPAGLQAGLEGLWTPLLNFRIGTSGCQYKCIACGNICPTAAIRPIHLDERLGRGLFEQSGPIRIGTAFVDRGRCLPWAMDRPCIVCQENCPVSPKAITTRVVHQPVLQELDLTIETVAEPQITLRQDALQPDKVATGDFFCAPLGPEKPVLRRILKNSTDTLVLASDPQWRPAPAPGSRMGLFIRLQQPYVAPERCIGCGVCEHECPVAGLRAIRVSAENETRNRKHRMLIGA